LTASTALRARDVIDLTFSIALFTAAVVGWGVVRSRASAKRVGPLLLELARAGIGDRAISWMSLALGVGAAGSMGFGHFGVGAAMCLASSACCALDGRFARGTGAGGQGSAVLDAAIDRYAELLVFGGVAMALRHSPVMLVVTLGATAGAIMVSYADAKAEALAVSTPGFSMGRQERAVTVVAGAALVPVAAALGAANAAAASLSRLPLVGALAFIAIVANTSAIGRLASVARTAESTRPSRSEQKRPRGTTEIATNAHAAANDALH